MDEEERTHASDGCCVFQGVFVGEFLPAEYGIDAGKLRHCFVRRLELVLASLSGTSDFSGRRQRSPQAHDLCQTSRWLPDSATSHI